MNNLDKNDIEECLNSNCRIKYITIDNSTDLRRIEMLKNLDNLAIRFELSKIPRNFNKLSNLKNLTIICNNLTDISNLGKLKNLNSLTILYYLNENLPNGFKFLQNITELYISGEFTNISDIEKMKNLKNLKISSPKLILLYSFNSNNAIKSLEINGMKSTSD